MSTHTTRVLTSGAVVHVWAPPGPAVAMVQLQHGFAEYSERYVEEYSRLVPLLVGRGIEVWGVDLLGHGRSPGRRGVVDVRRAVADHVEARRIMLGRSLPLLVLGHSLGGLVTAGGVTADGTGIAGAVLLSPALPPPVPAPVRRLLDAAARLRPAAPAPLPAAPPSELTRRADVVLRAERDPLMAHGRVSMLVAASALDVAAGVWAGAPRWQTPCLIVHGTADRSTDPRSSGRFAALLPAGVGVHLPIPDGRHELLHDDDAGLVLDRVLAFIGEHLRV